MNTYELLKYINKDKYSKNIFCGVKALDEISNLKTKKPCALIVNTQKSFQPGEHWLVLYVPKNGPIEYFDSFGRKPFNREIYSFIKLNGNNYIYNHIKLQYYLSTICGKYCLFYIFFRVRGFNYNQILKFFVNNRIINDKIVISLFKKL